MRYICVFFLNNRYKFNKIKIRDIEELDKEGEEL